MDVFIYISLTISAVEHIFMCLFFEKMSTQILSPFLKIGLLMSNSMNSLYILGINPLSYILPANIFPHLVLTSYFIGSFLHSA